MDYQDINAQTIDAWVRDGWEWGRPISHEAYEKALRGEWDVFLTPTKPVPHEWFGELKGKNSSAWQAAEGSRCRSSPRWARRASTSV